MTRGRHHNQACVVTEPAGDEHIQHPTPTPHAAFVAALRRSSAEKPATETLRDELDHLQPARTDKAVGALIEALQQTHRPDHGRFVREQNRHTDPIPAHSPIPITPGGPEL
jgi:hypothetical protein